MSAKWDGRTPPRNLALDQTNRALRPRGGEGWGEGTAVLLVLLVLIGAALAAAGMG